MTREVITRVQLDTISKVPAYRTKKLVHFFRAVALFTAPVRSSELGLRRRK